MGEHTTILLLGEHPGAAAVLAAMGLATQTVSLAQALAAVRAGAAGLALVDSGTLGGEAALHAIAALRTASVLPILVLAERASVDAERAYAAGATDVLDGALPPGALQAKARYFLTAERRSSDALRASEERYRTLFDATDEGVCIIDMLYDASGKPCDYRFLETNPAFVKHTGLSDAIGRTVCEMVPGHDQHWFDIYGRVASTGEPVRLIDEAKAMQRWYDVNATRIGGPGSTQVAVLFTDISERVKADAELRRLAADLAAADRRKNDFLATLAHELRNPLAPLRSGLQLMRLHATDADTRARVQDVMERQLSHMVTLVDDLLDVARITNGQVDLKREWVDVAQVVAGALETSMPLIDAEQHQLSVNVPTEPVLLWADPTRIRQVISNLLNNAAKYTPRGGRISLAVSCSGGQLQMKVTDNGIGIPAASLQDVFEMFTQVGRDPHRSRSGLGIGLSLVRSLVQLHGGEVSASSAGPGAGSSFTVTLPLGDLPARSADAAPEAPASATQAGLRILVVDDNEDAASMLGELLEMCGHTVAVTYGGQQALELAPAFAPQVAFLDIGMPGMNGYDTARLLRSKCGAQALFLVALTGWGGEDDRVRTAEAGFDRHLTKPVDLDAVLALLAEHALPVQG